MSACTLFYNSPFSGTYKYYWEQDEERFISNKDKHLFDENIAREVVDKLRVVL